MGMFHYAFEALKERKLRAILTILMVVTGGALITSIKGMSAGFDNYVRDQLSALSPNVLIVTPATEMTMFLGSRPKTTITGSMSRLIGSLPGVEYAVPYYRGQVVARCGGKVQTVSVSGVDQTKLIYVDPKLKIRKGEFVQPNDPTRAVLGSKVAKLDSESPFADLGYSIKLEYYVTEKGRQTKLSRSFIVKGVLEPVGNIVSDNTIYISPQIANSLMKRGGKYDGIFVVVEDPELNAQIEREIKARYGENLDITSPEEIFSVVKSVTGGVSAFILSIGSVSLLVGAIGIVTTLFTSVLERTKEIGILKALGFSSRHVLLLFLMEALIIGILGGVVGAVGGVEGSYLLTSLLHIGGPGMEVSMTPVIRTEDLVVTFFMVLGLSLVAGIYPAWRASKLDPVVALRKE